MRFAPFALFAGIGLLSAGSAPALTTTFGLTRVNNSQCRTADSIHAGTYVNYPDGGSCFETGALVDTNVARVADTGNTSSSTGVTPTFNSPVTLTTGFSIDAAVAVDSAIANDEYQELRVNYAVTLVIDSYVGHDWNLYLDHEVAGLLGLKGDGFATAVGTQANGHAHVSNVTLTGGVNTTLAVGTTYTNNPSNTSQNSTTVSSAPAPFLVASGSGDATINLTISFTLDAFSDDGCSGFICSSASGGEEAGALFGYPNASNAGDMSVDDYGTWGRAVGPDGYTSLWTLVITPEPDALALLALGLGGLSAFSRRR